MKEAMVKVPGGKLLRVRVGSNKKVQIVGDFFVHPEESIEDIEIKLAELDADFDVKKEIKSLKDFVKAKDIQLIGIDEEHIINTLKEAMMK